MGFDLGESDRVGVTCPKESLGQFAQAPVRAQHPWLPSQIDDVGQNGIDEPHGISRLDAEA